MKRMRRLPVGTIRTSMFAAVVALITPIPAINRLHAQEPTLDWIAQFESRIAGFSLGPGKSVVVATHVSGPPAGRDGPHPAEQHNVRRFDSAGHLLAAVDLNLPTDTWIDGLAAQSSGNFWIVGYEITQWGYDTPGISREIPFIAGYDAGGAQQFRVDMPEEQGYASRSAEKFKVDSTGNANWLFYGTNPDVQGSKSFAIRRYDFAGNVLYNRWLDFSSQLSFIDELIFDSTGNIFLSGATAIGVAGPPEGDYDALVVKTDHLGNLVNVTQFGSTGYNSARSITVDSSNNLWVGGSTMGNLGGPNAGAADAYIRKYDPNGNSIFTRQFGNNLFNSVYAVAVDSSDNLWAVGASVESRETGSDAFVRQYDPNGNLLFSQIFSTTEYEAFESILIDPFDNVFITGSSTTTLGGAIYGGTNGVMVKFSAAVPEPSALVLLMFAAAGWCLRRGRAA